MSISIIVISAVLVLMGCGMAGVVDAPTQTRSEKRNIVGMGGWLLVGWMVALMGINLWWISRQQKAMDAQFIVVQDLAGSLRKLAMQNQITAAKSQEGLGKAREDIEVLLKLMANTETHTAANATNIAAAIEALKHWHELAESSSATAQENTRRIAEVLKALTEAERNITVAATTTTDGVGRIETPVKQMDAMRRMLLGHLAAEDYVKFCSVEMEGIAEDFRKFGSHVSQTIVGLRTAISENRLEGDPRKQLLEQTQMVVEAADYRSQQLRDLGIQFSTPPALLALQADLREPQRKVHDWAKETDRLQKALQETQNQLERTISRWQSYLYRARWESLKKDYPELFNGFAQPGKTAPTGQTPVSPGGR